MLLHIRTSITLQCGPETSQASTNILHAGQNGGSFNKLSHSL